MYSIKCHNITGRWYKNRYRIIRLIGSGGVGEVYLAVRGQRELVAIKVSKSMLSITKEHNNMKKFESKDYIPEVYELDDCEIEGEIYHFFAMEYIEGYNLSKAMKRKLPLKLKIGIFIIILKIIADINEEGLVYSDLKHENIMIDEDNLSIRLIDYGSLTQIGRVINEYTPLYDRCSWGLGDRTADASYQACSAAILLMTLLLGHRLKPGKDQIPATINALSQNNMPKALIDLIDKALKGEIDNCKLFCEKLQDIDLSKKSSRWSLNLFLDLVIAVLVFLLGVVLVNLKALTPISLF